MKLIVHHALKDLRWLALPFTLWAAALVLYHAVNAWTPVLVEWQVTMGTLRMALQVIVVAATAGLAVLAALMVQADSPLGTTSFWFTRPITAGVLLASKLTAAAAAFVVVPAAIGFVLTLLAGLPVAAAVRAMPFVLLKQSLFVLPVMALASLTLGLSRFVMAALFGTLLLALAMLLAGDTRAAAPEVLVSRTVVGLALVAAASLSLLAHQYLTRRTVRSVGIAAALALIAPAVTYWPWAIVSPVSARTQRANYVAPRGFEVNLVPGTLNRRAVGDPTSFEARLQFANPAPEIYYSIRGLAWRVVGPDGREVSGKSDRQTYHGMHAAGGLQMTRVLEAVGGGRLLNSAAIEGRGMPTMLARLDRAFLDEGNSLRYSADVDLGAVRYEVAAAMPFRKGSAWRLSSSRTRIIGIQHEAGQVVVTFHEVSIGSDLEMHGAFLLKNPKRGELVVGRGISSQEGGGRLNQELPMGAGPNGRRLVMSFTESLPPPGTLDEEWLRDAELLLVRARLLGSFTSKIPPTEIVLAGEK